MSVGLGCPPWSPAPHCPIVTSLVSALSWRVVLKTRNSLGPTASPYSSVTVHKSPNLSGLHLVLLSELIQDNLPGLCHGQQNPLALILP